MKKYYYLRAWCSIYEEKAYYIYYADDKILGINFPTTVLSHKEAKILTKKEADKIMKKTDIAWEMVEGQVETIQRFI